MNALRRLAQTAVMIAPRTLASARVARPVMVCRLPYQFFSSVPPKRPALKAEPGCDLIFESATAEPINQPAVLPDPACATNVEGEERTPSADEPPMRMKSDKNMSIAFTCNVSVYFCTF